MALTVSNVTIHEGLNCDSMMFKGVTDGTTAAAAVYLGFVPRYIKAWNLTDGITHEYFPDNTAGTTYSVSATGTTTVAATNGFAIITGTSATVTKATGSPLSDGPGVTLGLGILLASKTFQFMVKR